MAPRVQQDERLTTFSPLPYRDEMNQPPGYGPPLSGYGPPGYPPQQGYPPQHPVPKKGMSTFAAVLLAMIVFFVVLPLGSCVACAVCVGVNKGLDDAKVHVGDGGTSVARATTATASAASTRSPSIAMPAEPVEVSMDVSQLLKDYKGNELRGDNKYKGKRVRIIGKAGDMKRDILNNIYMTVGTGADFEIPEAQCFFREGYATWISSITKGSTVVVNCTVKELMMNVLMEDCTVPSTDTLNACYKLMDAGIAKSCLMDRGEIEQTTFFTYGYVTEGDADKAMGTIAKLNKGLTYDDAVAQIQKNIDEANGSIGKLLGNPSARITVLLPPHASKDLMPRVKAVVDRLPPE
jgi:hypothetical protein